MTFDTGWGEIHKKLEWANIPDLLLQAWLGCNCYGLPEDSVFLDLGCGTGASALYIASRGYKVIAVDASQSAIDRMQRHPRILTRCEDIANLELPDQSINAVVDICCLQHCTVEDAKGVMDKAKNKWMRKGGLFLSKMATEPYDLRLSPLKIRLAKAEHLNHIFEGYSAIGDKITFWPYGKNATHWFIRGGI